MCNLKHKSASFILSINRQRMSLNWSTHHPPPLSRTSAPPAWSPVQSLCTCPPQQLTSLWHQWCVAESPQRRCSRDAEQLTMQSVHSARNTSHTVVGSSFWHYHIRPVTFSYVSHALSCRQISKSVDECLTLHENST